jgi:membrane protease YdiL (CAAX protease family)
MSEQQNTSQADVEIPHRETYIDAARRGKHTWPRYLLGFLLILFFWQVIGAVVSGFLITAFGGSVADTMNPLSLGGVQGFLVFNINFLIILAGIVLAVALIHRRSPRTLVTPRNRIDLKRVAQGFGAWFLIMCGFALVSFLLDPSIYWSGPDPAAFIPFALVALILTPIQTTTEELFFRGYLMQAASLISKNPLFLIIASGLPFMLVHLGNPEVGADFVTVVLYYFAVGAFFALISLKDGTTELAIGIHAANNLFIALVLNFSGSAFEGTPSLFYATSFDPVSELITFLVWCVLFYVLIFSTLKRRHSVGERRTAN